ncbi:Enhancer of mRNA-decapping protein 3 [Frankliniella fusca]|uniref:Enhancer of mRNA-decapping protein 3 n=1 Tax=Frankliniella fusca TaxID=407009 RepID=A0AAE1HBH3_9NEOP|nr:Enhancer of mRNA-decapping protein 3 [Frankliniella fusca]
MAAQWMGFTISIDCGPMGVFQGVVTAVEAEPQSVTLSRVFHNGVPHTSPSIVISALDIKDLTIIAAPQAQLDPVVELKKPIPTRPGRSSGEGTQNFHSQPAPPRMLHLNGADLDPRKAPPHLEYEPMIPQMVSLGPLQSELIASGNSHQASAHSSDRRQQLFSSASTAAQFNALQAALPDALRLTQAASSAAPAQAAQKLNTAQTMSQNVQARNQIKEGPGMFKLTGALGAQATQHPLQTGKQISSAGWLQPGVSYSSKTGQSSPSKPPQGNNMPTPSLRSMQQKAAESLPLNTAAQALFRGSGPHASVPSASALPREKSQGAGATGLQASPHKTARATSQGYSQAAAGQNALLVNADGYASGSGDGNRTPNRRDRQRQRMQARDEACFGSPSHNGFDQDFDFEKNLALFDKQAVFEEIAGQRPDIVQGANDPRRQQNYRHDQNILVNNRRIPTIIVPNPGSAEYVTDDGLIIPTMRPELLRQLHQKAHDVGFTYDRQSELFARCATEMSLQLLGGAHRLTPHNAHQWPTVIVMVGPHSQGAVGVMCARQLECQGVSTVVLAVNEAAAPPFMKRELNFYKCSGGPIVSSTDQLPETVDLVIMALAGHLPSDVANSLEYGKAASWASNKRAPSLALDPPPVGTPGIITRFALAPTLPVTYSAQNGKIYLCNLGIPIVVFKEMGIRYRSPFGSKFVIPLHPNDE